MKTSELCGQVCGIAVTKSGKKLPFYASRPAAGFPAPGDDEVENRLDLNDLIVKNPISTFFVQVEGDSMEGAGIFSGDTLVVDKSVAPHNGCVVVAAVYGELVVKRYVHDASGAQLLSENPAYAPIKLFEAEDVFVWGVVIGSVRKF